MKKMIQPEALKVGANRISANDARSVKLDFAPMEGITGYVFRQAHAVIYGGVDRYYSPFIAPGSSHKLTSRERNDILPEHNQGLCLIPQILTHSAEDFLWVCEELAEYGYRTVGDGGYEEKRRGIFSRAGRFELVSGGSLQRIGKNSRVGWKAGAFVDQNPDRHERSV